MSHEPDKPSGHAPHAGGHAGQPHKKHKVHEHEKGPGTPPWLISFGDMMTLFLCFFIMLVTMAKQQDAGLMAAGLGPFIAALENYGMDASLTGADRLQAVNTYRERFGLDPLKDPEQLIGAAEVSSAADIERLVKRSLRPYAELSYPRIAAFDGDSVELQAHARRYLDLIAETLRPGRGEILVLEGCSGGAEPSSRVERTRLAAARSQAVKAYLIREHGFVPQRIEARAWALEPPAAAQGGARVDARFIQPAPEADS